MIIMSTITFLASYILTRIMLLALLGMGLVALPIIIGIIFDAPWIDFFLL